MDFKQPVKFVPNIRSASHDATCGYNWGQPAALSRIVKKLPSDYRRQTLSGLSPGDSVAERWIVSDDLRFPSQALLTDGRTVSFRKLLEEHPRELLGASHQREMGSELGVIMKIIETHAEKQKGSLSVQVHPGPKNMGLPQKPEMWLGEGNIFAGWNRQVTEEEVRTHYDQGTLETLLNQYTFTGHAGVNVSGGLVHAIRYGSYIKEWSVSVRDGVHDLASATVALYDRTDGKQCRPGKEDFDAALKIIRENQALKQDTLPSFLVPHRLMYESDAGKIENMFDHHGIRVQKATLKGPIHLQERHQAMSFFIEQGSIHLVCDHQKFIQHEGEELFVPASIAEISLEPVDAHNEPAIVYYWHVTQAGL